MDNDGIIYMAPAVENLVQTHPQSVRLFWSEDVPENFGVYAWRQHLQCSFNIPDLTNASQAQLFIEMTCLNHAKSNKLNDTELHSRIGSDVILPIWNSHQTSITTLDASVLRQGTNTYSIFSDLANISRTS